MRRAADNPFAVHRIEGQRYRLDARGWDELLARLRQFGWRGAIVGPHGSGKTTLLEDLRPRLETRGWRVHLLRAASIPAGRWRSTDFVLCDEADTLGTAAWLALRWRTARAAGLVITSHRADRLPTVHRCTTTPELLRQLVASLGQDLTRSEAEELFRAHLGNVRDALLALYDRWDTSSVALREWQMAPNEAAGS